MSRLQSPSCTDGYENHFAELGDGITVEQHWSYSSSELLPCQSFANAFSCYKLLSLREEYPS